MSDAGPPRRGPRFTVSRLRAPPLGRVREAADVPHMEAGVPQELKALGYPRVPDPLQEYGDARIRPQRRMGAPKDLRLRALDVELDHVNVGKSFVAEDSVQRPHPDGRARATPDFHERVASEVSASPIQNLNPVLAPASHVSGADAAESIQGRIPFQATEVLGVRFDRQNTAAIPKKSTR